MRDLYKIRLKETLTFSTEKHEIRLNDGSNADKYSGA
jgi:hypothetical protein